MKRANSVADFALYGSVLSWTHSNGLECRIDAVELFPDFHSYNVVQQGTILNGIKQKCADGMASCKTGTERYDRMSGIINNLRNGIWSARGTGTGGKSELRLFAQVVADVKGKPFGPVFAAMEKWSKAQVAKYMSHESFAAELAKRREKALATVSTEDLEDEIDEI